MIFFAVDLRGGFWLRSYPERSASLPGSEGTRQKGQDITLSSDFAARKEFETCFCKWAMPAIPAGNSFKTLKISV